MMEDVSKIKEASLSSRLQAAHDEYLQQADAIAYHTNKNSDLVDKNRAKDLEIEQANEEITRLRRTVEMMQQAAVST